MSNSDNQHAFHCRLHLDLLGLWVGQALLEPAVAAVLEDCRLTKLNLTGDGSGGCIFQPPSYTWDVHRHSGCFRDGTCGETAEMKGVCFGD